MEIAREISDRNELAQKEREARSKADFKRRLQEDEAGLKYLKTLAGWPARIPMPFPKKPPEDNVALPASNSMYRLLWTHRNERPRRAQLLSSLCP